MKIGVVGATGVVGRMMLKCLIEQGIAIDELILFASSKSAQTKIEIAGQVLTVQELTGENLDQNFDYLLFSAGSSVAKKYAPIAERLGVTLIDNSSAFRRNSDIPLVIPEINGHVLDNYHGIIANPNCSTIQMLLPLYKIHLSYRVKKIIVATYQSVSGSGNKGIVSLMHDNENSFYPRKIEHNVIPLIGDILPSGYSEEEEKMSFETKKIFNDSQVLVSATTVRVPVIYGHSESIYVELDKPVNIQDVANLLQQADGIKYMANDFITPLELGDSDDSYVCRLREGLDEKSLTFWNVAHNVRVGAATNAVRILKYLINRKG